MKTAAALTVLVSTLFWPTTGWAGPNAGGALILALSEGTVYSSDLDYCDSITTLDCHNAVTELDPYDGSIVVLNCLAVLPNPERDLRGVTFGIDYDNSQISIVDSGVCGDLEITDGDWPAPMTGTAITWLTSQTDELIPVYWFAVLGSDEMSSIEVTPHPTLGGFFADGRIPSNLDEIAGYGRFGFNEPGEACGGDTVGACCLPDCSCVLTTETECPLMGGIYQGDDTRCDPNPCSCPIGACCIDGSCIRVDVFECEQLGGDYLGDDVPCEPDPCPPVPTQQISWGELKSTYR